MPTVASCIPRALLRPVPPPLPPAILFSPRLVISPSRFAPLRTHRLVVLVAASAASFDELDAKGWSKPRSSKDALARNDRRRLTGLKTRSRAVDILLHHMLSAELSETRSSQA